jgi:hypothetical protein
MWKSEFMEFCSHVHPITPVVLYTPLILYMLYVALWRNSLSLGTTVALFFVGVLIWTLLEYVIHRHIFRYERKTKWAGSCTLLSTVFITIIRTTPLGSLCRRA